MGLFTLLFVAVIAGCLFMAFRRPQREAPSDAQAEARRWIDRLAAGITNLDATGNAAATQALGDAAERHNAASVELAQARTPMQYHLAGQTAVEGLHYIRAARTALGLDPGPALPQQATGSIDTRRQVTVGGQEYVASPRPGDATPYYYPGGTVGGRAVPAGWYSTPWWKTALVAGAAGMGGALLMDTLLGGFGGHHHDFFGGGPGFGDFGGPGGPF
ncbi:hypothetical protein FHX82_005960 [Amycolatopsis bartoniae]|uniref:DUF1542 domain-containing protein n=1 Tax=Amycolatopsis bartoniae TaxID=941986 RepID=A0A8H9J0E1_9PSEU|nr:hypothetical protein [Amycolatopsis bartoniae]MBB2938882.1 hypothetical protein [Amycolatopsis bartoniae]TVT00673.1 hypothetical protein FNH07_31100 [Amycolatopsis bartoniae]GHF77333.1 hypothetical protein GCM10017566_59410 [Amycolatopsis bartoniae]